MKRTSIEDDLKILKVEYLRNCSLDHTQILNLSLDDQTIVWKILQMKTTSNGRQPKNMEYISNNCMDCDIRDLRVKLEENSEEILSVALLSPACLNYLSIFFNT